MPGDLEVAAQSCELSAKQEFTTSYCNEFKELKISGKKQYVNCKFLEGYAEFEKLEGCDSDKVNNLAKQLCETLKDEGLVNGKLCYINGKGDDEWGGSSEHLFLN